MKIKVTYETYLEDVPQEVQKITESLSEALCNAADLLYRNPSRINVLDDIKEHIKNIQTSALIIEKSLLKLENAVSILDGYVNTIENPPQDEITLLEEEDKPTFSDS